MALMVNISVLFNLISLAILRCLKIAVPLWKGTIRNDLWGHYQLSTHSLEEEIVSTTDLPALDNEGDAFEPNE